jgi:hypothetical protein
LLHKYLIIGFELPQLLLQSSTSLRRSCDCLTTLLLLLLQRRIICLESPQGMAKLANDLIRILLLLSLLLLQKMHH